MATMKRTNTVDSIDPAVDLNVLPEFVRNLVASQPSYEVASDEEFASALARATGRRFYAGDYEDKEFFESVAAVTPDAFKIRYSVEGMQIPQSVVDLVDVRVLLQDYGSRPNISPEHQELVREQIVRANKTYADWFTENVSEAGSAPVLAQEYEASSNNLSPLANAMSMGTTGETYDPTNPLASEGIDISGFISGAGGSTAVTQENQQFQFRVNQSRTIDNLIADLETGGEYFFNLEGFSMPAEGPYGAANWTPSQAVEYIYKLDENQLQDLQSSLASAGYYQRLDSRIDTYGQVDEPTRMAWKLLLRDAITFGKTPGNVLAFQIENYERFSTTNMLGVPRKDESEIYNIARETGLAMIGRGLDDRELSALTERIREWETEIGSAAWRSRDPEATSLNLQAKTEEYIRNQFEADYLTMGIMDSLKGFARALQ